MEKIRRSWGLVKSSWAVLRADKELALFPILSAICVAIAIAIIAGGFMLVTGDGARRLPIGSMRARIVPGRLAIW